MLFVNMVNEAAGAVGHEATVPTSFPCFIAPTLLILLMGELVGGNHCFSSSSNAWASTQAGHLQSDCLISSRSCACVAINPPMFSPILETKSRR